MTKKENMRDETLEIVFPKYEEEETSKAWGDALQKFPVTLQKITDWFKEYEVDSIQLSISGAVETGGITKLLVSAKGEGGMTVVLKPKRGTQ